MEKIKIDNSTRPILCHGVVGAVVEGRINYLRGLGDPCELESSDDRSGSGKAHHTNKGSASIRNSASASLASSRQGR